MLARLFKRTATKRPLDTARVPDGVRVYAIGDVHGRNDLLLTLLDQIERDNITRGPAKTQIIFLGDLVDRGDDSAGVIETAMALRATGGNVRFLLGNHEEIFVKACRKRDLKTLRFFLKIGGDATLQSYPIPRSEYLTLTLEELAERLPSLVPDAHLAFLESFEDQVVIGDYAFVHAGITRAWHYPNKNAATCAGYAKNLPIIKAIWKRSWCLVTRFTPRSRNAVRGSALIPARMPRAC